MTSILVVGCLTGALLFQTPPTVSDELLYLEAFAANPDDFVAAARRFDLQQQWLISWDRQLMGTYSDQREFSLVAAKRDDVLRRSNLIAEAWGIVLGHYPHNARALNYYGEYLYDYSGHLDLAVQQWLLALSIDDQLAPVHNNLGIHYFHHGRFQKGLNGLHKALELDPKNSDFNFNLAQMYLIYFPQLENILGLSRSKLYRDAMRYSRDAARYAPGDYETLEDYAANFYAAENFGVEADWNEAAKAWNQARAHARNDLETYYTWLNEGRTWIRIRNWERAADRLEHALALRPENKMVRELLDQVNDEMGNL